MTDNIVTHPYAALNAKQTKLIRCFQSLRPLARDLLMDDFIDRFIDSEMRREELPHNVLRFGCAGCSGARRHAWRPWDSQP